MGGVGATGFIGQESGGSVDARADIAQSRYLTQDGKWDEDRIAEALDASRSTVYRVRKEFVEEGLEAALYRKRPTGRQYRKLDGAGEAHLIALACSKAPQGRARWTMELLAAKMIELKIVDSISDTAEGPKACGKTATVRQVAASEVLVDVDTGGGQQLVFWRGRRR